MGEEEAKKEIDRDRILGLSVRERERERAFDTLDHPILLQRLETTFGISGTVLHWFASYVEGREQSVMVDNVLSSPNPLQFGVPQGSVLGPVLFTLYSQPLSDFICRHECDYHN